MTCDWKVVYVTVLLAAVVAVAAAKGTSAGKSNDTDDKHDERKTLSQQVAEGKYGLIQTELFARRPARPGVLSYERNSEVPRDDENTLGGLATDEIWLAEDHLLVLRGGAFHRTASEMPWQPIDEYVAPGRQVKIPARPKVPPPFPVQLTEGGPLQYLGAPASEREADGARPLTGDVTATPHPPTHQDPTHVAPGRTALQVPTRPPSENYPGGDGPGPFPFPPIRPPPTPLNQSIDYDDPSIYYPPPYSFYYHGDNSTEVPPGPLVPGIVLPPPPNFFAPLEKDNKTTAAAARPQPPPAIIIIPQSHRRPSVKKPPIHYLPYDDNSIHLTSTTPAPPTHVPSTTTVLYENDLQEQETPTVLVPTTPPPNTYTVANVPDVSAPYPAHRPSVNTQAPPTHSPTVANIPVLSVPYKQRTQPKLVSIISIAPKKVVSPTRYGTPTVSTVPYVEQPRQYLTEPPAPTPGPRPPHISVTIESVPYKNRPHPNKAPVAVVYEERPRTYLQPTRRPQVVHTVAPVTVHYLSYDERGQKPRTRLKPTNKPRLVQTVPSVVRVPYTRTQVSSSAVPLKNYFSSADVETNSVQPQPQIDYYFYEEDVTEPPRARYVQPTNFDRHVQRIRQQIQSYLKPTAKPVYEYSFQAANYQPTSPTPAPYEQPYVTTSRYEAAPPHNQPYYTTKHDERVLDDITNKYFTTFGQKLTTPVTPVKSLASDTIVNYRDPRPQLEPAAEYIESERGAYKKQQQGTYISYQLPGEGAHFYFLTPQLLKQQRNLGLEQQEFAQRQYEQQRLDQERLERRQRLDQQRLEQQEGRYRRPDVTYYEQRVPRRNNR